MTLTGMTRALAVCAALLLAAGCSDDGPERPDDGGTTGDSKTGDGGGPNGKKLQWVISDVDYNKAGKHAMAATNGTKVGVAYMRYIEFPPGVSVTCKPTFPGATPKVKNRPAHDLYYVEYDGSSWGTPVKVDRTVGPSFGLSIAMDKAGKAHIGYLGGNTSNTVSLVECSSSNAYIASSSNGKTWSIQSKDTAGATGDTVGHWMSVAVDSKGTVHSAYRDVHFGFYEQDGNTKASLRYDATKVSGDNGAGSYAALAFDASDNPIIAHYNATKSGSEGGIQLSCKTTGTWQTKQIQASNAGERLSLVRSGSTLGLVYYSSSDQAVRYMTSTDGGKNWTNDGVDKSLTNHGQYPSLAYDSKGNPAVSYYRCSDYGQSTCKEGQDGLVFAYYLNGSWQTWTVDTGDAQFCGDYSALVFNSSDQPVIAYRCVVFDNLSNEWVDTLKGAKGVWK